VNGFPMLISMLTGLTFGRTKRIANEIRKSRMTLFNGGNLLFARSAKDIFRLLGIISIPCLANKLKVPVGFLPQSLPSSKNAMGSRIISSLFHNSAFTYFRESESMASFNPQDYPEMKSSLDIAFFIKETNSETAKQIISKLGLQEKKFVPIIVRATTLGDQAFLSHEKSIETIETVLRAVDRLLEDDLKPLFVVQTRADLEITKKCQEALKDKCEVPLLEEYDPLVLRGIYSLARGIFTYRLHAAIFALAVGTPALGVYREIWGKKMPGIYKDLGISNLCCNCECDADKDELLANIELLGDDSKLNSVRDVFLNKIDSYKEELVKFLRDQLLTVG
ncbi:MAG: polysaccharide pyruvyl transferase family protein, partial [Anaerohalosphaera sp.]|nr:polysaccharide pyruvyl transferase family protein [Anaerohalosphaera sp.]